MTKTPFWLAMALLIGLGATLMASVGDGQETRGSARVMYAAPEGGNKGFRGEVALYDKSHAVVIGIDKYKTIRPLTGAVRDARAVEQALTAHGFEVTTMIDAQATRTAITEFLANELRTKVGKNDRVIIYFAGHGTTLGDGPMATGYLMPVDGDFAKAPSTGISMRELQAWLAAYPSKHVFYVADACYSGLSIPPATTRSGDFSKLPDYMAKVVQQPVRLSLVAGGRDEQVYEWNNHGLFTYYFLRALGGDADADSDGLITGDELASYVKPKVRQTAWSEFNASQNPHMGRRGDGEFILLNPGWKGGPPVATTRAPVRKPPATSSAPAAARPQKSTKGMIKIPKGSFMRGSEDGDSDEAPIKKITLDAFFIDEHEVTAKAYKNCVDAGGCTKPDKTGFGKTTYGKPDREKHPINGVTWKQAKAYCAWSKKRLPTEAEWEYAARGPKSLRYPWGSAKLACERAVINTFDVECSKRKTWPVGSTPEGASQFGVYDMIGNVAEWVEDAYESDFYEGAPFKNPISTSDRPRPRRVARGGSFESDEDELRAASREDHAANRSFDTVGFRCAMNP